MSNVVPLYPDDQYEPVGQHHHHVEAENGYEAILHHSDEATEHYLDHEKLDLAFDPCRGPNCGWRRHDD